MHARTGDWLFIPNHTFNFPLPCFLKEKETINKNTIYVILVARYKIWCLSNLNPNICPTILRSAVKTERWIFWLPGIPIYQYRKWGSCGNTMVKYRAFYRLTMHCTESEQTVLVFATTLVIQSAFLSCRLLLFQRLLKKLFKSNKCLLYTTIGKFIVGFLITFYFL